MFFFFAVSRMFKIITVKLFSCVINDCSSKRIDYCIINFSRVMDTARSVLLAYLVSLILVRNND